MPVWSYRIGHWHYPDVLAELTQENGPRSRAELDAVAADLARSAHGVDPRVVLEAVQTHFGAEIRATAERAAEGPCYDASDVDRLVAITWEGVLEGAEGHARDMASLTLRLAAHRGYAHDDPEPGIPYEGAFEAAELMFEETGELGASLMEELDRSRAERVFLRHAERPGLTRCNALRSLFYWDWGDDDLSPTPHRSYARLRNQSTDRCPRLDDAERRHPRPPPDQP